jgi:hypothetical protein
MSAIGLPSFLRGPRPRRLRLRLGRYFPGLRVTRHRVERKQRLHFNSGGRAIGESRPGFDHRVREPIEPELAERAGAFQFVEPPEEVFKRFGTLPVRQRQLGFDATGPRPLAEPGLVVLALRRPLVIDDTF